MSSKNLKHLSKDEKLRLIDLLNEKERRLRDRLDVYSPNAGQLPVHTSVAPNRFVFSGNGGGKTTLGVNEVIWAATGYNPVTETFYPVPTTSIVVLDHPDKVDNLWLPELKKWTNIQPEWLFKHGKPYVTEIRWPTGSQTFFFFHQQDATAFESISVSGIIVFDEPPPRHIWVALKRSGRVKDRQTRYLMIGTPITQAWMRTEIYERWVAGELPDTECFRFATQVNEQNLATGYIEDFSRVLTEKEKRQRLQGEFFDLEGLALAHLFRHDTHVIQPFQWNPDNPCVVAIDPHPSKAHVAVLLGVDEHDNLYYLDEYKEKALARNFAQRLVNRGWFQNYRVIDIVYDSLGSADLTGGEGFKAFGQILNEVLEDNEIGHARATTYSDKDDEDFIERIRDALLIPAEPDNFGQRSPKLKFFAGNPGIVLDIENVQWAQYAKNRNVDENKPKLDIRHRDYLSALKYALAANLYHKKPKEKMYRRLKGAESYGVKLQPSKSFYRMKLNLRTKKNGKI